MVAQPDERHANRNVPCCSGMTDTEFNVLYETRVADVRSFMI